MVNERMDLTDFARLAGRVAVPGPYGAFGGCGDDEGIIRNTAKCCNTIFLWQLSENTTIRHVAHRERWRITSCYQQCITWEAQVRYALPSIRRKSALTHGTVDQDNAVIAGRVVTLNSNSGECAVRRHRDASYITST